MTKVAINGFGRIGRYDVAQPQFPQTELDLTPRWQPLLNPHAASGDDQTSPGMARRKWPGPGGTNAELNNILHEYQVQDDVVLTDWELPWPYSQVMDPVSQITQTEVDMLMDLALSPPNPVGDALAVRQFEQDHNDAFNDADARYPRNESEELSINDNHNDAFRHAYWNALLTRDFGEKWAAQFATAHEGLPNSLPTREAMDLYNNQVGREIAAAHPLASPAQLADFIQQAISDGKLLVVDKSGNLAWSNQVPVGQCGTAQPADPLPGRPREDFNGTTSGR